jgi:basic membrane protein A
MNDRIFCRRYRHVYSLQEVEKTVLKRCFSRALIILLIVSAAVLPGCIEHEREPAVRVGIVFEECGLEDAFNNLCYAGAQRAEDELGIRADYVIATTAPDFEALQRRYAESSEYALIICTGANQADALMNVSADFPYQHFALIDSAIPDRANVASFVFRDEESSYLAGALAALVTKTDKLGFVGGMDIAAINRFLAGYQAGARYINPDCEIMISYAGSWADPAKGKELALAQYDAGAIIVFAAAGISGEGVLDAAEERGYYAIGVDTDQRYLAPDTVLVSVLKRTDVVIFGIIKETVDGEFTGGVRSVGLKDGGVGISLDNALPVVSAGMKERISDIRDKIISGEIVVPATV